MKPEPDRDLTWADWALAALIGLMVAVCLCI